MSGAIIGRVLALVLTHGLVNNDRTVTREGGDAAATWGPPPSFMHFNEVELIQHLWPQRP